MDEILFESTQTMDKKLFKEVGKFVIFKRKPIVYCNILALICFPIFILAQIAGYYQSSTAVLGYTLLVLYAIIVFVSYYSFTVLQHRRKNELSQGKDEVVTVQITKSHAVFSSSIGTKAEIDFSSFKKINETKNYIILISKAKQMYILDKNAFTKGTPDELVAFLKSKGIK